jgi:hypothetical protein
MPTLLTETEGIKKDFREVLKEVYVLQTALRPLEKYDFYLARNEISRCFGNTSKHIANWKKYLERGDRKQWSCLKVICNRGYVYTFPLLGDGKGCSACTDSQEYCVQVKEEHQRMWFRVVKMG